MVKLKTEQAWGQQDVVLAEPSSPVFILGAPCSDAASLATSLTASKDFWTSTESHLLYSLAGPDEDGEIIEPDWSHFDSSLVGGQTANRLNCHWQAR